MSLTQTLTPAGAVRRALVAAASVAVALLTCSSALALRIELPAGAMAEHSAKRVHVSSEEMAGSRIAGENPVYPAEAKAKKIQGKVALAVVIGKDGAPADIRMVESPSELLTQSATTAVRTWRWRPYLVNGEPAEVETTVTVTFNLEG